MPVSSPLLRLSLCAFLVACGSDPVFIGFPVDDTEDAEDAEDALADTVPDAEEDLDVVPGVDEELEAAPDAPIDSAGDLPAARCDDRNVHSGELWDGSSVEATCADFALDAGELGCTDDCLRYDFGGLWSRGPSRVR
ncbi:MAG: hypothetical protein ACJAYU_002610 [Bradymonadia bacterium]